MRATGDGPRSFDKAVREVFPNVPSIGGEFVVVTALAVAAIVAASIGQAMIKFGMDRVGGITLTGTGFVSSMRDALLEPWIIGGFLLILIVIPMWLEVLARLPLSVASPMVSLGYVLAVIIGAVVLNETIPPLRIAGLAMIMLGVAAVSFSA